MNDLPSQDPFFLEGQADCHDGVDRSDCPYDEGTDGQAGWRKGWDHEHAQEIATENCRRNLADFGLTKTTPHPKLPAT